MEVGGVGGSESIKAGGNVKGITFLDYFRDFSAVKKSQWCPARHNLPLYLNRLKHIGNYTWCNPKVPEI
jgi:hypothetical protein